MNEADSVSDFRLPAPSLLADPLSPQSWKSQEVVTSFEQRWLAVATGEAEAVAAMRRRYTRDLIRDFRRAAVQALSREWGHLHGPHTLSEMTKGYHIHHKHPVWFGGSNDFDNLVLIDDRLHRLIHQLHDRALAEVHYVNHRHDVRRKHPLLLSRESELAALPNARLTDDGQVQVPIHWPAGICYVPELHFERPLHPVLRRIYAASAPPSPPAPVTGPS